LKVGVIADIHSNLQALEAVLGHMQKVDALICAGDLVGYAAEPNEVVELIREREIPTVMGNHDYAAVTGDVSSFNPWAAKAALWTAEQLKRENAGYLRKLPEHMNLELGGKRVYVVHGSPKDPLFEYVFPDISNRVLAELTRDIEADVVVLAHTHVPMLRKVMGKLIVNPGGVGQPRDRDPRASYVVLTLGKEIEARFERVEYDVEEAVKKIAQAGLPSELGTRLYFGW